MDFDHHSPDFGTDQPARFAELRARCPVAYSEHYDGFRVASTYEGAFAEKRPPTWRGR